MVNSNTRLGPWPDLSLTQIRGQYDEIMKQEYDWEAVDMDPPSSLAMNFGTTFAQMCPEQLKHFVNARDGSCVVEYQWGLKFLETHIAPDGTYSTLSGVAFSDDEYEEFENVKPAQAVNIYFDWRQKVRGERNFPLNLDK